jgi:RecB family exonuclease
MSDEIKRLSASGIKKFRNCPKSFWYKYLSDIEPPDEGEVEHFQVGNAVHDSLEEVLQQENASSLNEQAFLSKLREEERGMDYNYEDSEQVQTCLEFASKFVSGYVDSVISVEDKYEMEIDGVEFVGFADLVADITDGGEELSDVIIDWKTGKENDEWKERVQGGMYVKMFHEEYGRWPDAIYFVYLNEGTKSVHNRIDDGEILWNDHQNEYWSEIESDVSSISNAAYNEEWEANVNDECYFCDYKYACSDYIGSEDCKPQDIEVGGVI